MSWDKDVNADNLAGCQLGMRRMHKVAEPRPCRDMVKPFCHCMGHFISFFFLLSYLPSV